MKALFKNYLQRTMPVIE